MIEWPKNRKELDELGDFTPENQPELFIPDGFRLFNGRGFHENTKKHNSWALLVQQEKTLSRNNKEILVDKRVTKSGKVCAIHLHVHHADVYLESFQCCETEISTARRLKNGDDVVFSGLVVVVEGDQPDDTNLVCCTLIGEIQ